MIPIVKGPEPPKLDTARKRLKGTPDTTFSWKNTDGDERAAVREALVRDQGGLCAYCMRRITADPSSSHVEHVIPQSRAGGADDPLSLDYGNMLGVCTGRRNGEQTCDQARGDADLAVNPLKPDTLSSIAYTADGHITAEDDAVRESLDRTLNLNCEALVLERRGVARGVIKVVQGWLNLPPDERRSRCLSALTGAKAPAREKDEYVGVKIYFLERYASRMV